MEKFRAKYPRGHYKTDTSYLRAVYMHNKTRIDSLFDQELIRRYKTTNFTAFRMRVMDYQYDQYTQQLYGEKPSMNNLLDRYAGSSQVRSKADLLRENALDGLRSDKEALKAVRKATGWNDKLDFKNVSYDAKSGAYIYENNGKRIKFDFTNSPKGVRVYE